MKTQSIITYTVWSLEVWGHSSDDCEVGCPCMVECMGPSTDEDAPICETCQGCEGVIGQGCPEGNYVHDDCADCDAEYSVNDRCKVGTLEVTTDEGATYNTLPSYRAAGLTFTSWHVSDSALTAALIADGYLKDTVTPADLEFDGEEDFSVYVNASKDGRPELQLEFESSRDV